MRDVDYNDEPMGKLPSAVEDSSKSLILKRRISETLVSNLIDERQTPRWGEKIARDSKSCLNYSIRKLVNAFTLKFQVRYCLIMPDMINSKSLSAQQQLGDKSTNPKPFSSSFLEESSKSLSLVDLVDLYT